MNPFAAVWVAIITIIFILPTTPAGVPWNDEFDWKLVNYAPLVTGGVILAVGIWWLRERQEHVHRPAAHGRGARRRARRASDVGPATGALRGLASDGDARGPGAGDRAGPGHASRARGVAEVDAAVARAKAAFPALARGRAGRPRAAAAPAWSRRWRAHHEELALLEARNAGKPIGVARGEIGMAIETFRYFAGAPERPHGETIPVAGGMAFTVREPLGVVGLITPWNFPLAIACWKLAPALAAGNTVVLKPAELTPLTALRFAELALEAGLPEGVVNVVVGPGRDVRAAAGRASGRREDRVHGLDRGRARRSRRAPRRRSSA